MEHPFLYQYILWALAFLSMAPALVLELRRDLMMLQQNSYRSERYMGWLRQSGDTTAVSRLLAYIILLLSLVNLPLENVALICMIVYGICRTCQLAVKKYKKPLVMTPRARRLFFTQLILSAVIILAAAGYFSFVGRDVMCYAAVVAVMSLYCLSHAITLAALWLLKPVEKRINAKFYNAAAERLASMPDLRVVGITGSYGKTSTKHYLHRILSEHFDTLMTPGSYNTTLGVVRTINELLKPYNEVFIVEMGAKQTGDIKEICDLVHPRIGIITAVGPQHLQTFHTIENVRDTKFELADALPADGLAVVNNDFEQSAGRAVSNTRCMRYGVSNPVGCNFTAADIRYSANGTDFTVKGPDGFSLKLHTNLVGECNISNLIAAVIVALELGVPADKIRYAVSTIQQVEHRLQMRPAGNGVTIIDDAFNSNPTGSRMALDVLASMKDGNRIVITPGMIELGDMQFELNKEFGSHMAECCDYAIIVNEYNAEAILTGLKEAGFPEDRVFTAATFTEAYAQAMKFATPGSAILIENDLPDTFK
ncbi:MAG: UDP-N-acetylmuramoyl-tripeptide--D-alanyl-D-alanine ligase [Bacteroidales bacterium]|nr:UDP-N-acetylmuramoyl-tripeptide--D-alanyl-D-alanine ligase [Bacteroidales bacterium]MDY2916196.1 UDP-N-acetylmuramoyl-tripeptide--D-alanyl-D-alanine ligase [Muribaculaceae bacterium]